jgi:hypothetical protein
MTLFLPKDSLVVQVCTWNMIFTYHFIPQIRDPSSPAARRVWEATSQS